jgi:hypothetical protein
MKLRDQQKLFEAAVKLQGRRKRRYISGQEILIMARLDRKRSLAGKRIRVYSWDGFVPNSYKYPATIDYIERWYDDDGNKHFGVFQTGASRSGGNGAQVTVNGRAYND